MHSCLREGKNELPQIMDQYYYDPKTVVESDIHIVVK